MEAGGVDFLYDLYGTCLSYRTSKIIGRCKITRDRTLTRVLDRASRPRGSEQMERRRLREKVQPNRHGECSFCCINLTRRSVPRCSLTWSSQRPKARKFLKAMYAHTSVHTGNEVVLVICFPASYRDYFLNIAGVRGSFEPQAGVRANRSMINQEIRLR